MSITIKVVGTRSENIENYVRYSKTRLIIVLKKLKIQILTRNKK